MDDMALIRGRTEPFGQLTGIVYYRRLACDLPTKAGCVRHQLLPCIRPTNKVCPLFHKEQSYCGPALDISQFPDALVAPQNGPASGRAVPFSGAAQSASRSLARKPLLAQLAGPPQSGHPRSHRLSPQAARSRRNAASASARLCRMSANSLTGVRTVLSHQM